MGEVRAVARSRIAFTKYFMDKYTSVVDSADLYCVIVTLYEAYGPIQIYMRTANNQIPENNFI